MSKLVEDSSLRDRTRVFRDRKEAGFLLAGLLSGYRGSDALVLGIPAGGVPVAAEIADELELALDLIIVRKVQIPYNPEAGFGSVAPDGKVILNADLVSRLGLTKEDIEKQIQKTKNIINSRNELFRKGLPFPPVRERVVIIVDDGLASGSTMLSALNFIKDLNPAKIVVAVPTSSERTVDLVLPHVDELVCLNVRTGPTFAVADAYQLWYDLEDEEVISMLQGFFG